MNITTPRLNSSTFMGGFYFGLTTVMLHAALGHLGESTAISFFLLSVASSLLAYRDLRDGLLKAKLEGMREVLKLDKDSQEAMRTADRIATRTET